MTEEKERVRDWWSSFMDERRKGGSQPSKIEPIELISPCQIEVFWVSEPVEGQLTIITNDEEREDRQFIIHGPISGSELVDKSKEVSKEDRWQKKIDSPGYYAYRGRKPKKRSDALASQISMFIDLLKSAVLTDYPKGMFHRGQKLWKQAYSKMYIGNIAENDIEDFFDFDDDGTSNSGKSDENSAQESNNSGRDNTEEKPFAGGYLYPPVWIEKLPERSFKDKILGSPDFRYDAIIQHNFNGKELVVFRDGLIMIAFKEDVAFKQILNTIFGVYLLAGLRSKYLKERDIIEGRISDGALKSRNAEITERNKILPPDPEVPDYRREVISKDKLEDILVLSENINPGSSLANKIILHLQAFTHLLDDEHTASFILNWTLLEQITLDFLNEKLKEDYNVNYKRRDKIQGRNWGMSQQLELAEVADIISEEEYKKLNEFRKLRNKVIHKMENVSKERSQELEAFTTKFLVEEVNRSIDN